MKYECKRIKLLIFYEKNHLKIKLFFVWLIVRTDLCGKNCPPKEKNGKYVQPSPKRDNKTGEWIAEPLCKCEDKYVLSNMGKSKFCFCMKLIFSRKSFQIWNSIWFRFLNKCLGVCEGVKCNHGICVPKGSTGYAWECNEDWNEKYCDKEYKPGVTPWIIAIAVLSVLVDITTIVAVIFAIRFVIVLFKYIWLNIQRNHEFEKII
jgi:hypothetical protein